MGMHLGFEEVVENLKGRVANKQIYLIIYVSFIKLYKFNFCWIRDNSSYAYFRK